MYPVLKIMHMLNFLDTFSMGITQSLSNKPITDTSIYIIG